MAQKNNKGRASRSAYNYDNDRPYVRGARPADGQRRSSGERIQGIPQRRVRGESVPDRGIGNGQRGNAQTANAKRGTPSRDTAPAARNAQERTGIRGGQSNGVGRPGQMPRNNAGRPAGGHGTPGGSQSKKKQPPRQTGTRDKERRQSREWIYPEGYTPPRPQRRADNGARRADDRRRAQQRKREPEPIIKVNWQRVGVIALAVLGRFLICLLIVAGVMAIAYRNMFYSQIKPPAKKVAYTFITEEGEGDNKNTLKTTMSFSGGVAYEGEELLVSFSELSKWLGCAQVGDVYSMRFIFGEGTERDEDVVFHNSSQNAFVNGAPVVMRSIARFDNGEVWVPLSFVRDYLCGVETVSNNDSVTLSLTGESVSFILRPSHTLTPAQPPED